mmetsp:Transcript_66209/g.170462  ORF Transcript_66209/g.170462 Transcript_66209/m.170462 type:complete len:247 (-) Transcript_66209:354-1094(-)
MGIAGPRQNPCNGLRSVGQELLQGRARRHGKAVSPIHVVLPRAGPRVVLEVIVMQVLKELEEVVLRGDQEERRPQQWNPVFTEEALPGLPELLEAVGLRDQTSRIGHLEHLDRLVSQVFRQGPSRGRFGSLVGRLINEVGTVQEAQESNPLRQGTVGGLEDIKVAHCAPCACRAAGKDNKVAVLQTADIHQVPQSSVHNLHASEVKANIVVIGANVADVCVAAAIWQVDLVRLVHRALRGEDAAFG